MTQLLINKFIKDKYDVTNINVRERYGLLTSIVGVICNFILFCSKLVIGFLLNSVAVMADSINNLSDCGSSLLTIIGFKMGNSPPDDQHPFGHGRMEYFAALGISLLIMIMGFEFLKSSIMKIFLPEVLEFGLAPMVVLFLTVLIKIWLSSFNGKIGKKINSKVLKATSLDARNDVIITSVTILSLIIFKMTRFNIDGYAGIIVALILIKNGFDIAKDACSPLLGEAVPAQLAIDIKKQILSYNNIIGVHDLIVHNYGPGKNMATIHVEIPSEQDINISHQLIDKIEQDITRDMGVILLIHMDPVAEDDDRIKMLSNVVFNILKTYGDGYSAHDFRIIDGTEYADFIFDLEVPRKEGREKQGQIVRKIKKAVIEIDIKYICTINVEHGFIGA